MERALSGNGLREIHEWVCEKNGRHAALSAAEITSRAVDGSDADCLETAAVFLRLLGRVTSDLALTFLPTDGIYLAGGVCRALAPLMETTATFRDRAKGRMSGFMDNFGVSVLLDDRAALGGCVEWLNASRTAQPLARHDSWTALCPVATSENCCRS